MELRNILKTRLWVYKFLSRCFYPEPSWKELQDAPANNLFRRLINMESEHVNSGLCLLADVIDTLPQWTKVDWEKLRQEYQRLFIGPGSLPVPPWESVYVSEERIILDEHTLAVREIYREWGLEVAHVNQEPDDHIGLELEFMAVLTKRGLHCSHTENQHLLTQILETQHTFLTNHLFSWVDQFCSMLVRSSKHPLYRGIAMFMPEYLRVDAELIEEIIATLKFVKNQHQGGNDSCRDLFPAEHF